MKDLKLSESIIEPTLGPAEQPESFLTVQVHYSPLNPTSPYPPSLPLYCGNFSKKLELSRVVIDEFPDSSPGFCSMNPGWL